MKLAVVGVTGAVGTRILRILQERDFPCDELVAIASPRSAGRRLPFGGGSVEVVALDRDAFRGVDLALFDVPDDVSSEWAPVAAESGATVIDNSAAWRMDPEVPLVVPEANPDAVRRRPKGIVASPNCTTLTMVVPLAALHAHATVTRAVVASYQAASGAGQQGIDDLWDQTERVAKDADATRDGLARDVLEPGAAFPHPIAMNVIPQCGSFREDGYTSEELKLCHETRKILDVPELPVTATCVRVPVMVGHAVAVHAEFEERLTPDDARGVLRRSAGVELLDDPDHAVYPTPLAAAGRDTCHVGRVRQDPFDDSALEFFSVADNLRKGAALNTVQVAELLLEHG